MGSKLILSLRSKAIRSIFFSTGPERPARKHRACGSIASSRGGMHVQEPYRACRCARRRVGRIADGRPRRSRRLGQRTDEVQSSEAYRFSDVVDLASSARHWHLGILCEQPAQAVSDRSSCYSRATGSPRAPAGELQRAPNSAFELPSAFAPRTALVLAIHSRTAGKTSGRSLPTSSFVI